jgi:hypothetical protein
MDGSGAAWAPDPTRSGVVDVVAAHGARGFFERAKVSIAGEVDLELVPFAALVATGLLPFGQLVVGERVELDPVAISCDMA